VKIEKMENTEISEAEFQRLAQTIATSIQKILQNVSTLQRMVNQFNTPQDSPDLKKQLHQIMTYTHQLVGDTNNLLKDLDKCKNRHLKIQIDRLVDEFTSAITAYQSVQRKTVDIEKNAVRQARAGNVQLSKPPSSKPSFFEDNFITRKSSPPQMQMQAQEEIDLQSLEEQERAIRELEENIVGVNEIYKKLGALVHEQGFVVDSIESSVEHTGVYVSQGTENLRKASQYRNKVRKKKLILAGILTGILLIIILILTVSWK